MTEIELLSDRDKVRTRPGSYIYSTYNPKDALVAIAYRSVNEVLKDNAKTIYINKEELLMGTSVAYRYSVADDGLGISLKEVSGKKITLAQLLVSSLDWDDKIIKGLTDSDLYMSRFSVVNYLSEEFTLYIHLQGHNISRLPQKLQSVINDLGICDFSGWYYKLEYHLGFKAKEEIVFIKKEQNLRFFNTSNLTPSVITMFIPDKTIWGMQDCNHMLNLKYLQFFKSGFKSYTDWVLDVTKLPEYKYNIQHRIENPYKGTQNDYVEYKATFEFFDDLETSSRDYAVNFIGIQSGVHVKMFERSLSQAFAEVFGECENILKGLRIFCVMHCDNPVSHNRHKLEDIPGFPVFSRQESLVQALKQIILDNRKDFEEHLNKLKLSVQDKKIKEFRTSLRSKLSIAADHDSFTSSLKPSKLMDCVYKNRDNCELFITDGCIDILRARTEDDPVAVYTIGLRPPTNPCNRDIQEVIKRPELLDFINAIGCGVDECYDLRNKRFGKIIFCFDEGDENNINLILFLGLIMVHMQFLLEHEMVYAIIGNNLSFNNAENLRKELFNPETRSLIKLTKGDLSSAIACINDPEAKKELINDHIRISKG